MRDDLMSEKIEINPSIRRASCLATKDINEEIFGCL
jgi:hypothetical protein